MRLPLRLGVCGVISLLAGIPSARAALPVDQTLTPEGVQVAFPHLKPKVIALSPDGRALVTSGGNHDLIVMDPANGAVRQTVALPAEKGKLSEAEGEAPVYRLQPDNKAQASFCGLVFSPNGSRLFLSDSSGTIKVFGVDATGRIAALRSFVAPAVTVERRDKTHAEIPAGLAVSTDGKKLYAAANLSNGFLELDAETGALLRRIEIGVEPYDVVLVGDKAYVSNWGGRRPEADTLTGPAGAGTKVRVDNVHHIASEGSVSVVDLKQGRVLSEILTGRHASGLARTPNGRYVVVANANEDNLSVLDTRTDKIVETISLRWNPSDLFGASPNALVFDKSGDTLYVCNGTQNAVAVVSFRPGKSKLEGLIPVGWFPGAVAFDPARKQIVVANLKGEGAESPSAERAGFNSHQYIGTVSLVPLPDAARLKTLTAQVLVNYRHTVMQAAIQTARPNQPARPVPERVGEPSVFKHVIYVIKENRTYDQVLGDIKQGNGNAELCVFGEEITPNQHKIAREFVLLDNTYCAGVLSADGHQWATTAIATDYIEKSFAAFPRSYPFGGITDAVDAMAYSPAGFIWDNAIAHGISMRNYGEFTLARVRWKDPARKGTPTYGEIHRDYREKTNLIEFSNTPGVGSLGPVSKPDTVGWQLNVPDQYRIDRFIEELHAFEQSGKLPALMILFLPNDHASGTRAGVGTPASYQADNDLAMGRLVHAVSHSPYWKDTCIFAIEDDPQAGWDHVSGYRTTAYVASAYTKRRTTISERYTQPGMLRTIELVLGMPPMNQMDAAAKPMTECFMAEPNLAPFDSVPNRVSLDEMNPEPRVLNDRALRRDALASAKMQFDEPDKAPEDELNQILWRAMKGTSTPYPKWAVLEKPDDDDDRR